MFRNYLKIAFRNLWKNRVFSIVNISGLALGITAFLFILEYIGFEQSANRFHTNLPSLYRVMIEGEVKSNNYPYVMPGLGPAAKSQFAEVRDYCRIGQYAPGIVTVPGADSTQYVKSFREEKIVYAEGSFFDFFSFPLTQGSRAALRQPNTVTISESYATKYFGKETPVGKSLMLHNDFGKTNYTVTGVYRDFPENSDLQYDMVFSLETLKNPANLNGNFWADLNTFESQSTPTFLWLRDGADMAALERKLNADYKRRKPNEKNTIRLQPAENMHLARSLGDYLQTYGNLAFVYLLGGVAVLILFIAWFNYVNLSTAGSLKRAKEVGIRKVVGAGNTQLIGQFLGESLLLNVLSFVLAAIVVLVLQPVFNSLIGKNLSLAALGQSWLWAAGLGLLLLGSLASGSYTAFALSSFQPIQTLKGVFAKSAKGIWLRKSLVVFQFSISIALIAGTFVLYRQLQYMQNQSLGMKIDQLLVIKGAEIGDSKERKQAGEVFQNRLSQLSYVKDYSNTGFVPGLNYNFMAAGFTSLNPKPDDDKKTYSVCYIDDRYLNTYGIAMAAGQNVTAEICRRPAETRRQILINEKAAAQLNFASAQAAVGKKIKWGGFGETQEYEVYGVVKDYHHESLQQTIKPIVFFPGYNGGYFTVRLTTSEIQSKMGELERLFQQSFPGNPFEYFFVDENYNKQYATEQQYSQIFTVASCLAIFIACLGLFGLATFMVEQRTKEIGIRKVLGADVTSLVALLSKDFVRLVIVALFIAVPLVWYFMNQWLQNFAYRADIAWWIFAVAGVVSVAVALITVGFQAVKAALANPVKSLRSE
ncbi:MAG: ABC transporter permease [Cytophagales bacterium]|nr:ABC transporter permease [Cytophagales bacterium]